jgi:hypothetical protein
MPYRDPERAKAAAKAWYEANKAPQVILRPLLQS